MKKVILSKFGKNTLHITELDTDGNTRKEQMIKADIIDYRSLMPIDLTDIEKILKKRKE